MSFEGIIGDIKNLVDIVKASGLAEIEIEKSGIRLRISNGEVSPMGPNFSAVPNQSKLPHDYTIFAPVNDTKYEEPDTKDFSFIKSPMVGTFYSAPSPDAPNYVEVNSEVDSHTVVCIIEAMKVMNEIEADIKGIIADILVKNGQTVEYGQPLFKLKKS